jgi:hypothetical protein
MVEYIFTAIQDDSALRDMRARCRKLVVGVPAGPDSEERKREVRRFATDVFDIQADLAHDLASYISDHRIEMRNRIYGAGEDRASEAFEDLDYSQFSLYAAGLGECVRAQHSDPRRDSSFWVYPKHMELHRQWDCHDPGVCKNRRFTKRHGSLLQYACRCARHCTELPTGTRAKHHFKNREFEIYNERDYGGDLGHGVGRLVIQTSGELSVRTFDCNNNRSNCGGTEDYRYIEFQGELWVVCNGLPCDSVFRQMYLHNVHQDTVVRLSIRGYDVSRSHQKNWTPYVFEGCLYFVYSFMKLCVVKLDDALTGVCTIVHGDPAAFSNRGVVFGGTNMVPWGDLFIGFGHSRAPYRPVPIVYCAKQFKFIYGQPMPIDPPVRILRYKDLDVQYPYLFARSGDDYVLSVCHEDRVSIHYTHCAADIERVFSSLLESNGHLETDGDAPPGLNMAIRRRV